MGLEGLQLGNYRLQRLIGRGSMGEIYVAEDVRMTRTVAVKVLRNEPNPRANMQDSEALRLFQREMQVIATLDHPGILPLLDFGEQPFNDSSLTYMVMPLRPEGSLQDWLKQQSSGIILPLQVVVHIIFQAASALQHAHNRRLIHMDVKPSNFLVRQREDHAQLPDLLLADFGIAKFSNANPAGPHITTSTQSTVRGTPSYMAPEQWYGKPVAATDQYALAMMAYQLLTGTLPFRGNLQHVMYQHVQVSPAPPSSHNPRIPPAVDQVILCALAKDPALRFPNIQGFGSALQQAYLASQGSHQLYATPPISQQQASFSGLIPPVPASGYVAPQQQVAFSAAIPPVQTPAHVAPQQISGYMPPQAQADAPSTSDYMPVPKKRSRLPLLLTLLLLLCLVGGGLGAAYFTLWHKPAPVGPVVQKPEDFPQLKTAYRGTLTCTTCILGSHTLRLINLRQDKQGKLSGLRLIDDVVRASFDGTINKKGEITLNVHQTGESATYTGKVFPDGHLEGNFQGAGPIGDGTWSTAPDSSTPAH